MRNVYHMLLAVALLLTCGTAWADSAGGYTYDFDTAFGTLSDNNYTDHAAAPDGWVHLPDSLDRWGYGSYTYPSYSYSKSGRNGTPCLQVSNQELTDAWGGESPVYDLLVTPAVSGTVTLWAKLSSSNGSVTFYNMEGSGSKLKRGSAISYSAKLTKSDWTEITLTGLSGARLGIRVSNAYIDDFAATSATVAEAPKVSLDATSLMGRYHDVADDGTYKLAWSVTITNTGKVPVDASTPGYSVSLLQGTDTLATLPLTATLQPGATLDSFRVEHVINYSDYKNRANVPFTLVENISGTRHTDYITLTPAKPVVTFLNKSNDRLKEGQTINFGSTKTKTVFTIYVGNDGGKTATVTAETVPDGFRIDTVMPLHVAPHTHVAIPVVKDTLVVGIKKGKIILGGDSTLTLNVVGSVIEPDVWMADFEGMDIPKGMVEGKWTKSGYPYSAGELGSTSCLQSGPTPSALITPLLEFGKNAVVRFNAANSNTAGSYATTKEASNITVYYSKDRRGWIPVKTISADADKEEYKLSDVTVGDYGGYYLSLPYEAEIPEGKWYIGFGGRNVYVDDIAGGTLRRDSIDMFAETEDLPKKGMVNNAYTASAVFTNVGDMIKGDVTPVLVFGDKEITGTTYNGNLSYKTNVELSYTPHTSGTFPVCILMRTPYGTFSTDTVNVEVAPESGEGTLRVGTPVTSMWSNSTSVPVVTSYALSRSEIILPASALSLAAGAKIKGFAFKGMAYGDVTVKSKILVGNDTISRFNYPYTFTPNDNWQTVFDDTLTIRETFDKTTVLSFTLDEPLVYDGTNLHLYFDNKLIGKGAKVEFERAEENYPTILQQAYSGTEFAADDTPYNDNAPVVYLDVDQAPHMFSGKVTDKATGKPLAGIKVSLTSGDIAYETTTATDGTYSLTVYKYDRTYDFSIEADGYMPVHNRYNMDIDWTVNTALSVAKGLYIEHRSYYSDYTVNHPIVAKAVARNMEKHTLRASDYTATLFFNGKAVAKADTKDLAPADTAQFNFTYTPHEATENAEYYIAFATADATTRSDTSHVTIQPEKAYGIYQAGDSTGISSQNRAPANFYYQSSEAEIIYPASELRMPAGTRISRAFFRGYTPDTGTDYDAKVRVYIANTTDPVFPAADSYSVNRTDVADTTKMLKVYDGTYRMKRGIGSAEQPDVVLDLHFTEPFTYEGGNIRLYVVQTSGDKYMNVNYLSDSYYETASFMRYADTDLDGLADKSWYQRYLPVTYFEASQGTKVSGTVKQGDKPLANAQVTLTNGDVLYTATTDNDGHYEMLVVQNQKKYRIAVSDGSTELAQDSIDVNGTEMVRDFTVEATGIAQPEHAAMNGKVYDLNGRHVADVIDGKADRALRRGVYMVNGKKIVVK